MATDGVIESWGRFNQAWERLAAEVREGDRIEPDGVRKMVHDETISKTNLIPWSSGVTVCRMPNGDVLVQLDQRKSRVDVEETYRVRAGSTLEAAILETRDLIPETIHANPVLNR